MNRWFLVLLLAAVGCSTPQTHFLNQTEVIGSKNSTYDAALLTGGIWVENQPLLINQDFNFGIAMSIESVGPAIAAGMRINKNKEVAALLENWKVPDLAPRVKARIADAARSVFLEPTIAIYGILYGNPKARLQVIVELKSIVVGEPPLRLVAVSEEYDIDQWTQVEDEKLSAEYSAGIEKITDFISKADVLNSDIWDRQITEENIIKIKQFKGIEVDDYFPVKVLKASNMPKTIILI